MAIKELFYDQRPVALLNAKAAQRIDSRFTFTRDSVGSIYDTNGLITYVEAGAPRFSRNPKNLNDERALLIEPASVNSAYPSDTFDGYIINNAGAGDIVTANYGEGPDGTPSVSRRYQIGTTQRTLRNFQLGSGVPLINTLYCISFFYKGDILDIFSIAARTGPSAPVTVIYPPNGSNFGRAYAAVTTGDFGSLFVDIAIRANTDIELAGIQVEQDKLFPTSYIKTTTTSASREADLLSIELPIPESGSIYIDASANFAAVNDTLVSVKNAANEKINLGYDSNAITYNSLALLGTYNGSAKAALPLPVPTTSRERNIITWGTNNYQYGLNNARFAQSLSTSVPSGLIKWSIGHDSVDPTIGFNGYVNSAYLYEGEITPAVAEALVRGELDPINADTFVPTGPPGSLALVINTQGLSNDGDRVFVLPAESAATDNDIVITWGDNTESGLENAAAELGAPGLEKTYTSAGIYSVFVEGKLENLQFNNSASAKDLVQIVSWGTSANGNDVYLSPSTLNSAFYGCSQLDFSSAAKTINLPDTSGVTDWFRAFKDCSNISGVFPQFNFSSATTLREAFANCSSLTAFTPAGNQTQNVTDFTQAWFNCSGLTAFPLINTSSGTNFTQAWQSCTGLQQFPQIVTSSATTLSSTWSNCSSLLAFPNIVTSSVTIFNSAWSSCSSLSAFPPINTSSGTQFNFTWTACSGLSAFPNLTLSSGTSFIGTWSGCSGLAAFPPLDFSNGTNFDRTWANCSGLSIFPAINTSNGTNFGSAWAGCSGLSAFPQLDFDAATGSATDSVSVNTGFYNSWINCTSLTTFPANRFNNTTCNRFLGAWKNCALDVTSIENILVSINAAGTSDGNLSLEGGTNANRATWTVTADNAYNALIGRGWTITFNP